MTWTTVEYWQNVGTGEVCAVRVGDDGAIVSARGPLSPAEVGAALFGDPPPLPDRPLRRPTSPPWTTCAPSPSTGRRSTSRSHPIVGP